MWQGKEKIKYKVAVGGIVNLFNIILIIGKSHFLIILIVAMIRFFIKLPHEKSYHGNKAMKKPIISRYAKQAHIANIEIHLRKTRATGEDQKYRLWNI